jgi:hypothetical protein
MRWRQVTQVRLWPTMVVNISPLRIGARIRPHPVPRWFSVPEGDGEVRYGLFSYVGLEAGHALAVVPMGPQVVTIYNDADREWGLLPTTRWFTDFVSLAFYHRGWDPMRGELQ